MDEIADGPGVKAPHGMLASLHLRDQSMSWSMRTDSLPLDSSPGAPWLLLPGEVRAAFNVLVTLGTPLACTDIGRPLLGVKCGCNAAFIASIIRDEGGSAMITADGRTGHIEQSMLRPLVRGEGSTPWILPRTNEMIIWTHDQDGVPLDALPPLARRWLAPWKRTLAARSDARPNGRWWSLFRTEAAGSRRVRVMWPDIAKAPRAAIIEKDDNAVPLNSCYVVALDDRDDALAFAALLNSPLASAWLNVLAEPARGGYRRYLGWTVSMLPIPRDWRHARKSLVPLARRALEGEVVPQHELLEGSLSAYGIRHSQVADLLAWNAR